MTTKQENSDNQELRKASRRDFLVRGVLGFGGLIFFPFSFTEIFAQSGKSNIRETLKNMWRQLKEDPPPTLEDWKELWERIRKLFCKHFPEYCSTAPKDPYDVYKLGRIYVFPTAVNNKSSSVAFYFEEYDRFVIAPPLALYAISEAADYLKRQGIKSSSIIDWIFPRSPKYTSDLETVGECYVYESTNGRARIQNKGKTYSGYKLNMKVVSNEPDNNLRLDVPEKFSPCSLGNGKVVLDLAIDV